MYKIFLSPQVRESQTHGVILADQIKSLDWSVREVKFVESLSKEMIEEVQAKIEPLFL